MVLVKTCKFFLYLSSVRKEREIRFNNVLNRKETFFDRKNYNFSMSQKWHFSKGVNPCFWSKKCLIFLYLDLVEIRLEIRLNNIVEKKQTIFDY